MPFTYFVPAVTSFSSSGAFSLRKILLRDAQQLPDERACVVRALEAFRRRDALPHGSEG
jgi:hypothetical protein